MTIGCWKVKMAVSNNKGKEDKNSSRHQEASKMLFQNNMLASAYMERLP